MVSLRDEFKIILNYFRRKYLNCQLSIINCQFLPPKCLFPVDIPYPLCYNKAESEYQFQCSRAGWALGENRESGATPERYRHCKRGGRSMGRKPVIGFSEKTLFRAVDA